MPDEMRADVLLVTATRVESNAVLAVLAGDVAPRIVSIDGRIYFDLGVVNGARIWMTLSEMGSGGVGASQQAVEKGIIALSPVAVVMVGIAFGINEEKQAIGDVLVTESLRLYELQRVGEVDGGVKVVPRGDRAHASPWLINHFRSSELMWSGARVRFGAVLTGEKLVDNLDYRAHLRGLEPEAIGGEMEGAGLYTACHGRKVDWILVKAICDWADGQKATDKDRRQELAARNAATFVAHALRFAQVDWNVHRRVAPEMFARLEGPSMALRAVTNPESAVVLGGVARAMVVAPSGDGPSPRSTLPHQAFFFGRMAELATIADAIAADSRTWGALIDGPGGIGKTALAIRAGHLAPTEAFEQKIFVSAKTRELTATGVQEVGDFTLPNFIALLTELGHALECDGISRLPESERVHTVRRALTNRRVLLVIDNVETFPESERARLYQFLSRLPVGCKAIVTSRRRTDVDARTIRLDRLEFRDAVELLNVLSQSNRRLAVLSVDEQHRLYEMTGGNPLLLRWMAGQLGQTRGHCRTVDDACTFLEQAPAGNDPLEYAFGDLLDTFTPSESAVLAALAHFSLPAEVRSIALVAGLAEQQVRTALEDLADRALLVSDAAAQTFVLPSLTGSYLRRRRPEDVTQTTSRLVTRVLALIADNGGENYERFPTLEDAWPMLAAALPLLLREENLRLQGACFALATFLNFSGRWDELLSLNLGAEARAKATGDFLNAGWRASHAGFTYQSRGQVKELQDCAVRASEHWKRAGAGPRERAVAIRLRGAGSQLGRDFVAAIAAYEEAVVLLRRVDSEGADMAIVLNDLANAERRRGNFPAAKRNYLEALRIARKLNRREQVAIYTGNMVVLALDSEDWESAERLGHEALKLAESMGYQPLIGVDCERLARSLSRQGRAAEGLPYAQRAVDILSKLKAVDVLEVAQATLAECLRGLQ